MMNELLVRIRNHAHQTPNAFALRDERTELNYAQLIREIDRMDHQITGRRIGLLMDNSIAWACLDLAILQRGSIAVPMPGFFTEDQLRHLIANANLDEIVTDHPERVTALLSHPMVNSLPVAGYTLSRFKLEPLAGSSYLPPDTAKITYTSGTTGKPKGVCLSSKTLIKVTKSLCEAVGAQTSDRCLSILPLSTLLENITGLYAPLWMGASAQVPSLASCGFTGSSGLRIEALFATLNWAAPTITVLVPQLLKVLVMGIKSGIPVPKSLRFIAVGGAPVAQSLLTEAKNLGLPAFQGYGLSEAGSVTCLNLPGENRPGSVGKPLQHVQLRINQDGEVVISGDLHLGYLGTTADVRHTEWLTGDLGYLDEDGYLFLVGRKKTAFATAFGRNVAPEWVEASLTSHPSIAQAAVFGEGHPFNVAVLVPRGEISVHGLEQIVHTINQQLPDYARITRWVVANQPFTSANQMLNQSGFVQRQNIYSTYRNQIESFYLPNQESVYDVLQPAHHRHVN